MRIRVELWVARAVGTESGISLLPVGLLLSLWKKGQLERSHGESWRGTAVREEDSEAWRGASAADHLSWLRWGAVWPA